MRYSYNQGVEDSWHNYIHDITDHIKSHNWLPVAVGSITILWLGLLFVDIRQAAPVSPGDPSKVAGAVSGNGIAVSYKTNDNLGLGQGSGVASNSLQGQASVSLTSSTSGGSSTDSQVATVADSDGAIIGGKGADETPTSDGGGTTTEPPVSDPGVGVTIPPIVTVDPPVIPTPGDSGSDGGITVDLSPVVSPILPVVTLGVDGLLKVSL